MSDAPQQPPQETPSGVGFGELNIDDSKIDVIRHPDNAHLDQPSEPEQPPA